MTQFTIVVAGTGFPSIRQYINEAMPKVCLDMDIRLEMIDAAQLRTEGFAAEMLIPTMARIDSEMMDRIRGLRLIQQWGAGLEGVDIEAATLRGIAVANVPTDQSGNADSVAEWCVMAAIGLSRRLPVALRNIHEDAPWGSPRGRSLLGRTAGIVGLGGIGQALAARLKPFGMRLIGLERRPDPALAQRLGLEWIGAPEQLTELLHRSDYLFLCVPLNQQTRGLIDETALARLPDQACVINAARGQLMDERAVLRALSMGRLLGAALDVYEVEPLNRDSPLLTRTDIIATPHVAGVTDISYRGIARHVAENVRRSARNELPHNCANCDANAPASHNRAE